MRSYSTIVFRWLALTTVVSTCLWAYFTNTGRTGEEVTVAGRRNALGAGAEGVVEAQGMGGAEARPMQRGTERAPARTSSNAPARETTASALGTVRSTVPAAAAATVLAASRKKHQPPHQTNTSAHRNGTNTNAGHRDWQPQQQNYSMVVNGSQSDWLTTTQMSAMLDSDWRQEFADNETERLWRNDSVAGGGHKPTALPTTRRSTTELADEADAAEQSLLADRFKPAVTPLERCWMNRLLNEFADRLLKWNITSWFLHGGTLLGCYRFGDFIPWDDDVDVSVADSDRSQLVRALTDPSEDANFTGHWDLQELNYKFYTTNFGVWTDGYPWPWPSIDIFFHRVNGSVLSDVSPYWSKSRFDKNWILPLGSCSLAGRPYPAPVHIRSVLRSVYGNLAICKTYFYNHKTGDSKPVYSTPCRKLTRLYHFNKLK